MGVGAVVGVAGMSVAVGGTGVSVGAGVGALRKRLQELKINTSSEMKIVNRFISHEPPEALMIP